MKINIKNQSLFPRIGSGTRRNTAVNLLPLFRVTFFPSSEQSPITGIIGSFSCEKILKHKYSSLNFHTRGNSCYRLPVQYLVPWRIRHVA